MSPIRISRHAREQMVERGVEEGEVIEAIRSGEELPAKRGRKKFRKNFSYGKEWSGKFYRTKQVVPVIAEEKSGVMS